MESTLVFSAPTAVEPPVCDAASEQVIGEVLRLWALAERQPEAQAAETRAQGYKLHRTLPLELRREATRRQLRVEYALPVPRGEDWPENLLSVHRSERRDRRGWFLIRFQQDCGCVVEIETMRPAAAALEGSHPCPECRRAEAALHGVPAPNAHEAAQERALIASFRDPASLETAA